MDDTPDNHNYDIRETNYNAHQNSFQYTESGEVLSTGLSDIDKNSTNVHLISAGKDDQVIAVKIKEEPQELPCEKSQFTTLQSEILEQAYNLNIHSSMVPDHVISDPSLISGHVTYDPSLNSGHVAYDPSTISNHLTIKQESLTELEQSVAPISLQHELDAMFENFKQKRKLLSRGKVQRKRKPTESKPKDESGKKRKKTDQSKKDLPKIAIGKKQKKSVVTKVCKKNTKDCKNKKRNTDSNSGFTQSPKKNKTSTKRAGKIDDQIPGNVVPTKTRRKQAPKNQKSSTLNRTVKQTDINQQKTKHNFVRNGKTQVKNQQKPNRNLAEGGKRQVKAKTILNKTGTDTIYEPGTSCETDAEVMQKLYCSDPDATQGTSYVKNEEGNITMVPFTDDGDTDNQTQEKQPVTTRVFHCALCGVQSEGNIALQKHHQEKHPESGSLYYCDFCGKHFMSKYGLQSHVKSHSKDTNFLPELQCKECGKELGSKTSLTVHMRTHSGERPFKCDLCPRTFAQKANLKRHMESHTGIKILKCTFCGKKFKKLLSLEKHALKHDGHEQFECNVCGLKFKRMIELKVHAKVHKERKKKNCQICGKDFETETNLKIHIRTHTKEKPFPCEVCGKSFSRKSHLDEHSRTHMDQKAYFCHLCGKDFNHIQGLNYHLKVHTGKKDFECQVCGKLFMIKRNLTQHMLTHSETKTHGCEHCGKMYSTKESLVRHLTTHSGERPFKCNICGKGFLRKEHLKLHDRVHSGEKPYHCLDCGKSFSQACQLTVHKRLHSNNKPFSCDHCNKSFNQLINLKKHSCQKSLLNVKNLIKEKQFKCNHCEKVFKKESDLNEHVVTHDGVCYSVKCELCGNRFTQLEVDIHTCGSSDTQHSNISENKRNVNLELKSSEKEDSGSQNKNECMNEGGQSFADSESNYGGRKNDDSQNSEREGIKADCQNAGVGHNCVNLEPSSANQMLERNDGEKVVIVSSDGLKMGRPGLNLNGVGGSEQITSNNDVTVEN